MNFWKDIPLKEDKFYNVINEIPEGERIKYELSPSFTYIEPIRKIRYKYPFNYGSFPRTLAGDSDPLDAIIISDMSYAPLTIIKCKVIGMIKTIDEGEVDNKIILIPFYEDKYNLKTIRKIFKFLKKYKYPYNHKTKIDNKFYDIEEAIKEINNCNKIYNDKFKNTKTIILS